MTECEVNLCQHTQDTHGIRTKCFACGMPACTECSEVVPKYHKWRRVRLCLDCMEDRPGEFERYPDGHAARTIVKEAA